MGLVAVVASGLVSVSALLLSTSCFIVWRVVLAGIRAYLRLVLQLVFSARLLAAALIGLPHRIGPF